MSSTFGEVGGNYVGGGNGGGTVKLGANAPLGDRAAGRVAAYFNQLPGFMEAVQPTFGIQKAVNQVGTLKFDGLIGDYKYGTSASQRNPSRASTINKIVVGQPIGLQIVAQNLTSQAAKNIKFKG